MTEFNLKPLNIILKNVNLDVQVVSAKIIGFHLSETDKIA